MPAPEDASRVLDYYVRSQAHLAPFSPPRPEGFLTEAFWRTQLAQNLVDLVEDRSLRLYLVDRDEPAGRVLGQIGFTQIFRGPFQACVLGYGLAPDSQGRGYMFEALSAAIAYVFDTLGLHRIGANYIPDNVRSGRLLQRLGFAVEGYAEKYLFINGAWRDHVLTARYSATGKPHV
jgi:ribosomal-protein-alanine N-acetyltransferase